MSDNQKRAMAIYNRMKGFRVTNKHKKKCSLVAVDEMYNGIIHVAGELKARGELSGKSYLKVLEDMNTERESVITELNRL